jgi:hypothetical protein
MSLSLDPMHGHLVRLLCRNGKRGVCAATAPVLYLCPFFEVHTWLYLCYFFEVHTWLYLCPFFEVHFEYVTFCEFGCNNLAA